MNWLKKKPVGARQVNKDVTAQTTQQADKKTEVKKSGLDAATDAVPAATPTRLANSARFVSSSLTLAVNCFTCW